MLYKFSVGDLIFKQSTTVIKTVDNARSINIEFNITTHKETDAEGVTTDETVDEQTLTITAEWTDVGFDSTLAQGEYYDITLQPSVKGTGMAFVTFARCRLTNYSVRSAQGEFVIVSVSLTKTGPLDSTPGTEPTKQKIKFGDVYLGDSATLTVGYDGNVNTLVIPTALGVLVRSTQAMGGGQLSISVSGYVKKNTRLELEQYLISLYTLLDPNPNTLTVEYGLTTYTVPNCYFSRGSAGSSGKVYDNFSLEFLKSAYS